jgi:hypothetical protein
VDVADDRALHRSVDPKTLLQEEVRTASLSIVPVAAERVGRFFLNLANSPV